LVLNFSSTEYNDDEHSAIGGDNVNQIWQPDLYIEKLIDFHVLEVLGPLRSLLVFGDGTVWHKVAVKATVGCDMNFNIFPMDTQYCQLIVSIYLNSKKLINMDH
jgi:hypothetical protein